MLWRLAEDGRTTVSLTELAGAIGRSRRHTMRVVARLEAEGLVERRRTWRARGLRGRNVYMLRGAA